MGGEETALFRDLALRGEQGFWIAEAGVSHRIGPDRLTLAYVARYFRANVASNLALGVRVLGDRDSALRLQCRILWTCIKFLWDRLWHEPEKWLQTYRSLNVLFGVRATRSLCRADKKGGEKCQKARG